MIRALLLIVDPIATWGRIVRARRGVGFILVVYVLPLLVLSSVAEAYGLLTWGKMQVLAPRLKHFTPAETALYEMFQFALSVGIIFLGAKLVKSLGETFHGRHTFQQTFTLVAYGLSPLFLLRLLDAFRGMSPWVTWLIGIALAIGVLYHGVPPVMEPDPPQAFGLYVMTSVLLFLITGLARFFLAGYLQGRFTKLEVWVSWLAQKMPF
jgi:hypothetical protein